MAERAAGRSIDLNADAGEDPAALRDGREAALYLAVTTVNIACGGHAGDAGSVCAAVALAAEHGCRVVAHPSYPDRAGFGRCRVAMGESSLAACVQEQVALLAEAASAAGLGVPALKPHGALYHAQCEDESVCRAVAFAAEGRAVVTPRGAWGERARGWYGLLGTPTVIEGFCDRLSGADGRLAPRGSPGAVLDSPEAAADLAAALACDPAVETLCVHGDSAGAAGLALAVRARLERGGVVVRAPGG